MNLESHNGHTIFSVLPLTLGSHNFLENLLLSKLLGFLKSYWSNLPEIEFSKTPKIYRFQNPRSVGYPPVPILRVNFLDFPQKCWSGGLHRPNIIPAQALYRAPVVGHTQCTRLSTWSGVLMSSPDLGAGVGYFDRGLEFNSGSAILR